MVNGELRIENKEKKAGRATTEGTEVHGKGKLMGKLNAYHVFTSFPECDNWGVLVFAESPNMARTMCVDFYGGGEEYIDLRATRLPAMDAHAPESPKVLDSGPLVKLSEIHICPTCGRDDCDWRCWDE